MKSKIIKHNFVLVIIVFMVSIFSYADIEKNYEKRKILIRSDIQTLDMIKNIVTFSGNVQVIQGTIKIVANTVVILRSHGIKGKEVIYSYGNPVFFYQKQHNGKIMKGHAIQIHYEPVKNLLLLTGNAYLNQINSSITGDKIYFFLKERKIQAYSKKDRQVNTTILLSSLEN